MKKLIIPIIAALLAWPIQMQAQTNAENTVKIDSIVNTVMNEWKIPGISIAILKDNEVIHAKGFGIKSPEGDSPVNKNTVFQIGSITKSFTAALVAMLVDEGKLKWEDKIIDHLPDFKMYDTLATQSLLVKDIMAHRTGLREQAGTYIPNLGYGRDDVYRLLARMKPRTEVRSAYAYNNITFLIAEKLIEKYTGKSWEENIKERIFEPLGMTLSSMNEDGFLASADCSVPCEFEYEQDSIKNEWLYGDNRALYWLTVIGPAGSINSTATDLLKWTKFHLNNGKVDDKELISEKNMKYLHTGQLITSMDSSRITVYGQCWFIEQTNRYRLYFHTGSTWGYTAVCAFVPEINLGIVVLTNSGAPSAPRYTIMRSVIDLFMYGKITKDYHAELFGDFLKNAREREKKRSERPKEETAESLPYDHYAGNYSHEFLGKATITLENGKLSITAGKQGWTSELEHVNGHKFKFRMQGHTFPVKFSADNDLVNALEIDFGCDEDFGKWDRQ